MRTLAKSAVALLTLGLLLSGDSAHTMAADVYWGGSNANFNWTTGPWKNSGGGIVGVPVDGDNIRFRSSSGTNAGININGAITNLPNSSVFPQNNNTVNLWIYDGANLTPNNGPPTNNTDFNFGGFGSIEAAASASQAVTVNTIDYNKKGNVRWYVPVNATTHEGPQDGSAWYYGPVNFGSDVKPSNNGWRTKVWFFNDYTATTKETAFRSGNFSQEWFHGATTITNLNMDGGAITFEPTSTVSITNLNFTNGVLNVITLKWTPIIGPGASDS